MIQLREFTIVDAAPLVELLNNDNVVKYLTSRIPFPYEKKDADWWVNDGCKDGIVKAIEYQADLAGVVAVNRGEYQHSRTAEIGYWLGEQFWGKGIATEAVREMTEMIFSTTDIVRLFAPVFEPNKASMRVLEKCGYKLDAIFDKGVFKDGILLNEHVYSQVIS
jgi:ribosomal-protein-alanine N-acetyltransferase